MEVEAGIGTEYNRERFQIRLQESDLDRLVTEFSIREGELTLTVRYEIMALEAERFVLVQAPKFGRPVDDVPDGAGGFLPGVRSQLRHNREQFAELVASVSNFTRDDIAKMAGLDG